MHPAVRRLVRRLTRRPAPVWPADDLPSVYLPAGTEPPAPGPEGEPDWCTWRADPAVQRLLAAAARRQVGAQDS
ncbi:hypothetical protein OG689_44210 [Kitasatospora sp. NBC_00240]|uniref:hypothetical protein n=1 Tax=Kitasatospora sp. NBC_00240 TaxID=2903567 RepID=UPI002258465F|nr:hypothetical protein [Kitasatospora sp. NBC_00240]MCX5216142.1 hypothetical protein [Kitasatospora sp. NBC_00240]